MQDFESLYFAKLSCRLGYNAKTVTGSFSLLKIYINIFYRAEKQ